MSHLTVWLCRACGEPLGVVQRGELRPIAAVRLSPSGVGRVQCPACGQEREWRPNPLRRTA